MTLKYFFDKSFLLDYIIHLVVVGLHCRSHFQQEHSQNFDLEQEVFQIIHVHILKDENLFQENNYNQNFGIDLDLSHLMV